MLFNSYVFIFLFLPVTLIVFHSLLRRGLHRSATVALALASLVFYGWWSIKALCLLLVLMAGNYFVVWSLLRTRRWHLRPWLLTTGIVSNLAVLGYFKYANFFLETWGNLSGNHVGFIEVALPLGLSFFTFQKIALLVDAYKGRVRHFDPLDYVLFVSFFPQLIAGPIVHHSEVMPQFGRLNSVRMIDFGQGLTLFVIGLSKKVLIADTIAHFSNPIYDAAALGMLPSCTDAWIATLAYALQLYFDFSGYSDMAIGLGLLFGIRLPVNFESPYQASNIVDFWRRWHMTLSRFLRDYLYIPLGGNQRGQLRRYGNLLITMLLGGLWHGAAWTFVVWGVLHGIFLTINHLWSKLQLRTGVEVYSSPTTRVVAKALTFVAVLIAWVFFRAANLETAGRMLSAMMFGSNTAIMTDVTAAVTLIAVLLAIVWFAPNSSQLAAYTFDKKPMAGVQSWPHWSRSPRWAAVCGVLLALCLMSLTRVTEFLYFQF
jgi:alginate O-acetyltransferase complex protein AlgI